MRFGMGGVGMFAGLLVFCGRISAQDGSRQWRFTVNGYVTFSSPALSPDGETVYIGVEISASAGRVLAIGTRSAVSRWGTQGRVLNGPVESSPAVAPDGTIYIGCNNGHLYGLRPADGSIAVDVNIGAVVSSSPAIGSDGTIYVGASDNKLHAITPTGAGFERWAFTTDYLILASPVIGKDGTIYVGSLDKNFYAITPDGREKWRFGTAGGIFASAALDHDGTIYFGSGDQKVYALTPDGAKKWEFSTGSSLDASPALGADSTIYFPADRNLYALRPNGPDTERLKWKTDIATGSASTPVVRADGTIIFGADDAIVRAFNSDGTEKWRFNTGGGPDGLIESSPTIGPDGSIYIGSNDGNLYKLNGNGSVLSSFSSWPSFRGNVRNTARASIANSGGKLINISTRAQAGGGKNLIAGFVVQAPTGHAYLIRGVGPSLTTTGVSGFMPDPRLDLFTGSQLSRSNDNWMPQDEATNLSLRETAAAVQAFPLIDGSPDAAILPALSTGVFTTHVRSADGRAGVALVEVYDVPQAGDVSARVLNLSTRGYVGTGEEVLIAGFVVGGTGTMRLLLRGIGPGLAQFGVPGVLGQPRLTLFSGATPILSNTGWTSDGTKGDLIGAAAAVSAFPLSEAQADSAMLFEAKPGAYTIQISGVGNTTGEAMVEIYVLP